MISVSQEDNARKALEALRKLSAPKARVIRAGLERRLESSQLVPGDIILLEAGDYVPADGRVLWEAGLQADESAMTGESLPCLLYTSRFVKFYSALFHAACPAGSWQSLLSRCV